MFAVPEPLPAVTMPVAEPTDATPALLLDHVPPETAWFKVVLAPEHKLNEELVIAAGVANTVKVATWYPPNGVV
jgi:hypothetical protein